MSNQNTWTDKHLNQLKNDGRIRGYKCATQQKRKNIPQQKQNNIPSQKRSKEKEWLAWNLLFWANEHAVELATEYLFDEPTAKERNKLINDKKRKWRFDWAFYSLRIAVEYEGGIFSQYNGKKSGHHTAKHYTKDTDKYNRAQALGWRVIRVTALNYKTVLQTLNDYVA